MSVAVVASQGQEALNMKKQKLIATFADGQTITRTTAKPYTHAFQVCLECTPSPDEQAEGVTALGKSVWTGFASSRDLAEKGARYYSPSEKTKRRRVQYDPRSLRKITALSVEIVQVSQA
jgi:hypothetical protein